MTVREWRSCFAKAVFDKLLGIFTHAATPQPQRKAQTVVAIPPFAPWANIEGR